MNVHKHARMTSHGRLLLVQRIRAQGWRVAEAAAASGVSVRHGLQVAGAASDGAASPPSTTGARRRPVAAPNAGRDRRRHRAIAPSALERTADRAPPERPHPIAHRALDRIEPTVEKMFVRGGFKLLSRRTNAIADHGVGLLLGASTPGDSRFITPETTPPQFQPTPRRDPRAGPDPPKE